MQGNEVTPWIPGSSLSERFRLRRMIEKSRRSVVKTVRMFPPHVERLTILRRSPDGAGSYTRPAKGAQVGGDSAPRLDAAQMRSALNDLS